MFLFNPDLDRRACRRPPAVLASGDFPASRPAEAGHEPSRFVVREAGRRRLGDDRMDENHFPVLWSQDGHRTPGLAAYVSRG